MQGQSLYITEPYIQTNQTILALELSPKFPGAGQTFSAAPYQIPALGPAFGFFVSGNIEVFSSLLLLIQ